MKPVAILRAMLFVVALSGLHCVVFLVIPSEWTIAIVKGMKIELGADKSFSPLVEYWMLMMAAICVVVGYLYLVAALNPGKHKHLLPFLGWSLVFIGLSSAAHGVRLGLPPWPFYGDLVICAVCGPGIISLARRV